jgi:hypothetical protein
VEGRKVVEGAGRSDVMVVVRIGYMASGRNSPDSDVLLSNYIVTRILRTISALEIPWIVTSELSMTYQVQICPKINDVEINCVRF